MSSFVKLAAVTCAVSLVVGAQAQKAEGEKPQKSPETGEKKKESRKKAEEGGKSIDVPVPKGHDAKGLKIPYFDDEGKLQMTFNIGVAKRIDDTHIEMSELQVETFDEDGLHEMAMDLPTSVLDLTTSVITAQQKVTIKREDFELTGNAMIFNTKTKQGGLGGKVRMLIYNLENEAPATPAPPPSK